MNKYRILVKGIVQYQDKYLVVRKWYDDRVLEPYQWQFIDGTIEFNEAPDKAVLRHIYEQTGISATLGKPLYTWSFLVGDVFNIGISYLCYTSIENVILSEELTDSCWIAKEEFENYIDAKVREDIERAEL
jgi:nucleoside triphosphatase